MSPNVEVNHPRKAPKAFTLIELLVVIGVIGLVTAGLTFSLKGGGQAQSLQAGQGMLISLLSSARAQAAINQREAAILVWGDENDSERYLRHAAVGLSIGGSNTVWEVKGDGISLAQGVYFVPSDAGATGPAKLANPPDWESGTSEYKTLSDPLAAEDVTIRRLNTGTGLYETLETTKVYVTARYTPTGQLGPGSTPGYENQLVIAAGEAESASSVRFDSPEQMRGVHISNYGIPTIINEKLGFK